MQQNEPPVDSASTSSSHGPLPDPSEVLSKVPAVAVQPDTKAIDEKQGFENAKEIEDLTSLKQDRAERLKFGRWIFTLVCVWLGVVCTILFLAGFKLGGFSLESSVLIALLGTTTVNIVGVLLAVTGYLFPKRP